MTEEHLHKFAIGLAELLNRLHDQIEKVQDNEQPFGACLVIPRHSLVRVPNPQIQKEIEQFATNHFLGTKALGYYLRYSTPPLTPIDPIKSTQDIPSINDYIITLEHPKFDEKWQQTMVSRALIYCIADNEVHSWDEWFELQIEAIRFTTLLHQRINEASILNWIQSQLLAPALPFFETFIYKYALTDTHVTICSAEKENWINKKTPWQTLYPLAANMLNPDISLEKGYKLAHKKATSTRTSAMKSLWNAFLNHVEKALINDTPLPDNMKTIQIEKLRSPKKRPPKVPYQAKRPALCISDLECAQVLYTMIIDFINSKKRKAILAESIIFIWIAQHAAFSGLQLTGTEIRSLKIKDINFQELAIKIAGQELHISGGLKEILSNYFEGENPNYLLFQNLSHDNLEDILARASAKLFGDEKKLLPKDFLEAVHVIPGLRISTEIRRQIDLQAKLIKNSPYRIKPSEIKKDIIRVYKAQHLHT